MTDKSTLINIESTNTFEQWRTLTNSQTDVIKKAVTMGNQSGENIGDVTLKGSLTIAPGVFTDPVHNSLGHLNVNKIYAQTDVDPYIELGDNVEVIGDWLKLNSNGVNQSVELQFQNNGTDSWGISTNANHTELIIGDSSHDVTFDAVSNSITSSNLIIHNDMLGSDISNITIGANGATTAAFSTVSASGLITASGGVSGDLTGDVTGDLIGKVRSPNGTGIVLFNGSSADGAGATFKGNIINADDVTILGAGTASSPAIFIGNVTGNLTGTADLAVTASDAHRTQVVKIHSPHEDPVDGPQGGDHYITFVDGAEDVAYTTERQTTFVDGQMTSFQNLEDHSDLRYHPSQRKLKVPNIDASVGITGDLTGDVTGDLSGNATKATYLDNKPSIGGVQFDGYKSINLKGVNTKGDQDTSGKAATAGHADKASHSTKATSATTASTCTGNAAKASSTSGNASTATRLLNARNIGGVSFNGTASINLPGVNISGNQNTSGKAATAGHADTASKATNATNANKATQAIKATKATNADNATFATKAGHADSATTAGSSGQCIGNSNTATKATKATKADKATTATTATKASKATQADYWTNARTLTLKGDVSGSVNVQGNAAMSLGVTVNSGSNHSHSLSQITDFDAEVGKLVSVDQIWPIGSVICMSNDTNPQNQLSGSWTEFGKGQVLVGASGTRHYSNNDPFRKQSGSVNAGRTGGKYTYTLKNSELPSHRHVSNVVGEGSRGLNASNTGGNPQVPHQRGFDIGKSSKNSSWTSYEGGGGAFQVVMPYRTVRWWVRYA